MLLIGHLIIYKMSCLILQQQDINPFKFHLYKEPKVQALIHLSGCYFDAAKHIETNIKLDAGQSSSGDYWTNVLGNLHNKSSIFIYGEILQDGTADNIAGYETFMNVTATNYGGSVRSAITSNNLSRSSGMGGIDPTTSVDFFETHDTFEDGSTSSLTDWQRKMGWAIVDSRAGTTPLLFVRPTSSIGSEGDSLWKKKEPEFSH